MLFYVRKHIILGNISELKTSCRATKHCLLTEAPDELYNAHIVCLLDQLQMYSFIVLIINTTYTHNAL